MSPVDRSVPPSPPGVVALSPGDLGPAEWPDFERLLRAALACGLDGFVLREPAMGEREFLDAAARARDLAADAWLCIHDRLHVARAVGADAAHLGFRSLPTEAARAVVGPNMALGVSFHRGDDPKRLREATYSWVGPVRDTPSKHGWKTPLGFEGLAEVTEQLAKLGCPVHAIGGLTPIDVPAVRRAKTTGVIARAGLIARGLDAAQVERRVREWRAAWVDANGEAAR